ncbi:MAG: hypothetical protein K5660_06800 [Paludibacteraceae bacterium]|nr:hypothetical protein [Paludibacteraceae bacterium]
MPKQPITHSVRDLPLVAVELGSHSVRAMAAEKVGTDLLRVLAYEESNQFPCVNHGMVNKTNDAGFMINDVLHLLSNRLGVSAIPSAYTLIGGKGMKIAPVKSKRDLVRKRSITEQIKNEMKQECIDKIEHNNPDVAVFDIQPSYYVLDGVEQDNEPTDGQKASVWEIHFNAFVGFRSARDNMRTSFENAKITIEQSFARPDVVISALTTGHTEMLNEGCAVVDFGAQTTTLTIYKGNQFLLNLVVPQGGWHISRFIEQQGVPFNYAEHIKCKYGKASPGYVERDSAMLLPSNNPGQTTQRVSFSSLAEFIEMKLTEILQPVIDALVPYKDRLGGVYLTGGASLMSGLVDWLQERTSLPVQYGSHAFLLDRQTDDEFCNPRYSSLIGALIHGSDWRDSHTSLVVPDRKSFASRVLTATQQKILYVFTDTTKSE